MRYLFILLISLVYFSVFGQTEEVRISREFQAIGLERALEDISTATGLSIYYKTEWLDSTYVTGSFKNATISEVLETIFSKTSLFFYIEGDEIFITNNVQIISQPRMEEAISDYRAERPAEPGLVFEREYLGGGVDKTDIENYVFEIGNRKSMIGGGRSTLAGYVKEKGKNTPIEGAYVYSETVGAGTVSDENGFYTLSLPNGKHSMIIQYISMQTTSRKIVLFSDGQLNIDMEEDIISLSEVTISADRDQNVKSAQMGAAKINAFETKNVPVVLGEKDIMKVAATMPGVQTLGEGSSGYYVRGGKADQNLITLNGANIYNPSHFFGFFSVFNSDGIEDMEIYKSGTPVQFDSRLSSVFEIESKKSNTEKFEAVGGLSPITSKLTMDIPVIKGKSGLFVGGRGTYSNWVLQRVENANFKENKVSFGDVNLRYDHQINEDNSITLSTYYSLDKFRLPSDTLFSFSNYSYYNANSTLSWTKWYSKAFNSKVSVIGSEYGYSLKYNESPPNAFQLDFRLTEYTARGDFNFYPSDEQEIRFGIVSKLYKINPGDKYPVGQESLVVGQQIQREQGLENALYISDQYEITPDISLYAGLRYNVFMKTGPTSVYEYIDNAPINDDSRYDTINFSSGKIVKAFHGLEPRLSARYSLDEFSSVKLSYNRNRQNLHTLSNTASLSPTDVWRLSGRYLKPQIADQLAIGYYKNIWRNTVEGSVEAYYKQLKNLVDFKTGEEFLFNPTVETAALQGPGRSYGVELLLRKSVGKFNGWFNYTWSRTFMKLDGEFAEEIINNGKYFPANYDKPHSVNLVANYKFTRRLSLSYNFVYNTGRPVTYPVAAYDLKGMQVVHYSHRNSYRIPNYMRMDIGINIEAGHYLKKLTHSYWSFSVYNILGRDNPFSVFFDVNNGKVNGYQLIIFGSPIPTVSYNFRI